MTPPLRCWDCRYATPCGKCPPKPPAPKWAGYLVVSADTETWHLS